MLPWFAGWLLCEFPELPRWFLAGWSPKLGFFLSRSSNHLLCVFGMAVEFDAGSHRDGQGLAGLGHGRHQQGAT